MKVIFALLVLVAIADNVVAASQSDTDTAKPINGLPAGHVLIIAEPAAIRLTRKGTVLEVIDSPMYTYIQVTGDKDPLWLAAYKANIAKGDIVNYSDGAAMNNFYSKSLSRTFETIVFVDRIVPEKK